MASAHPIQSKVQADAVAALKDSPDAYAAAARVAADLVASALRSGPHPPREVVLHACHGAMAALVLQEKDPAKGAVQLMRSLGDVAQTTGTDPMDMMTWAMEGIARIAPLLQPAPLYSMREAIENAFMGAGTLFNELCAKAK